MKTKKATSPQRKQPQTNSSTLPTKAELLAGDLVAIDRYHRDVKTNSLKVASAYDKRPGDVNRIIGNLVKKGLCKIASSYYLNDQNKKQKYYELDRTQFLNVVMNMTGEKAMRHKAAFIDLFDRNEDELIGWREGRRITSETTKLANAAIFELQKRLQDQYPDSKKGDLLFIHLQNAINISVTGSAKVDREQLTEDQLDEIAGLESNANSLITEFIDDDPMVLRDDVIRSIKAGEVPFDKAAS